LYLLPLCCRRHSIGAIVKEAKCNYKKEKRKMNGLKGVKRNSGQRNVHFDPELAMNVKIK
jgi:hypothetical protein